MCVSAGIGDAHASSACGWTQAASASRSACVSSWPTGWRDTCTSAPPAASSSASSVDLLAAGCRGRHRRPRSGRRCRVSDERLVGPVGQHRAQQRGAAQYAPVAEEQLDGDVGAVRVAERDHARRVAPVVRAGLARPSRASSSPRARRSSRSRSPTPRRAKKRAATPSSSTWPRGLSSAASGASWRPRSISWCSSPPVPCSSSSVAGPAARLEAVDERLGGAHVGLGPPRADVRERRQHAARCARADARSRAAARGARRATRAARRR